MTVIQRIVDNRALLLGLDFLYERIFSSNHLAHYPLLRKLADLVVQKHYDNTSGGYWAVRGEHLLQIEPLILARDDAACAALWEDSARLTGLPCD